MSFLRPASSALLAEAFTWEIKVSMLGYVLEGGDFLHGKIVCDIQRIDQGFWCSFRLGQMVTHQEPDCAFKWRMRHFRSELRDTRLSALNSFREDSLGVYHLHFRRKSELVVCVRRDSVYASHTSYK